MLLPRVWGHVACGRSTVLPRRRPALGVALVANRRAAAISSRMLLIVLSWGCHGVPVLLRWGKAVPHLWCPPLVLRRHARAERRVAGS